MRTDVDADSDLDTGPWRVRGFEALYHLHVKITRVNRLHGKISAWTQPRPRKRRVRIYANGGFASVQTSFYCLLDKVDQMPVFGLNGRLDGNFYPRTSILTTVSCLMLHCPLYCHYTMFGLVFLP
jgi:hypothetical protein